MASWGLVILGSPLAEDVLCWGNNATLAPGLADGVTRATLPDTSGMPLRRKSEEEG